MDNMKLTPASKEDVMQNDNYTLEVEVTQNGRLLTFRIPTLFRSKEDAIRFLETDVYQNTVDTFLLADVIQHKELPIEEEIQLKLTISCIRVSNDAGYERLKEEYLLATEAFNAARALVLSNPQYVALEADTETEYRTLS